MNPDAWRFRTRLVASLASGGLLLLAFPPVDAGWAAVGAPVPLLLALRGARGRAGFLLGFASGAAFFGGLLWWVSPFGTLAWGVLVAAQALYLAVFGWFAAWASRGAVGRLVAAPLLWVAIEILRTRWPLGGFAWGDLGYTQYRGGTMLPLARVGGVHLVSLAVVAVACLAAEALARGAVWRRLAVLAVAGGVAAAPALAPLGLAGPSAGTLDVALVQGNVPEGRFTGFADRIGRVGPEDLTIIDNHVQATLPLAADPPDLVVWPENALDRDPFLDPEIGRIVEQTVQTVGAPFIVGAILDVPGGGFRNANLLYDPDGRAVARYDKLHLVPFGEYVPWPVLRRYVPALEQIPEDGVPGESPVVFDLGAAKVGAVICFESTYPELVRRFVAEGAQVIVVSTNNASFRRSPLARQHVQMSALRAVEEGRTVLHAAIAGITAVIAPDGRILERTRLFTSDVVRRRVPLASGLTPYARFGDAIEIGLAGLGTAAALVVAARMAGRRRARRYARASDELWGEVDDAARPAAPATPGEPGP